MTAILVSGVTSQNKIIFHRFYCDLWVQARWNDWLLFRDRSLHLGKISMNWLLYNQGKSRDFPFLLRRVFRRQSEYQSWVPAAIQTHWFHVQWIVLRLVLGKFYIECCFCYQLITNATSINLNWYLSCNNQKIKAKISPLLRWLHTAVDRQMANCVILLRS